MLATQGCCHSLNTLYIHLSFYAIIMMATPSHYTFSYMLNTFVMDCINRMNIIFIPDKVLLLIFWGCTHSKNSHSANVDFAWLQTMIFSKLWNIADKHLSCDMISNNSLKTTYGKMYLYLLNIIQWLFLFINMNFSRFISSGSISQYAMQVICWMS